MMKRSDHAIAPYEWEAHYRDGTSLAQWDDLGGHYSSEIDCAKLKSLQVLHHPVGPIQLAVRREGPQPERVAIFARVRLTMPDGDMERDCYFVLEFPESLIGVLIDHRARVTRFDQWPTPA